MKGREAPLLSGSGPKPTLVDKLKEKRNIIILAVAAAAIVLGVVLYLVLGGKTNKGMIFIFISYFLAHFGCGFLILLEKVEMREI